MWNEDGPAAGTQVVEGACLIVIIIIIIIIIIVVVVVVWRSVSAWVRLLNSFEFLGVEVRFLQR